MPLQIIRQDVTTIKCDAIVNPTNRYLLPGGGVDELIHERAGENLRKACELLGEIQVGQAKITPAFDLPCKYVIHTVGPIWQGGGFNEKTLLKNCYVNSLKLAVKHELESIAIPLISSGAYNYPKDKVLKVAVSTINKFLKTHELNVYLVVYDKTSYEFSKRLYGEILKYVSDNFDRGRIGVPRKKPLRGWPDVCLNYEKSMRYVEIPEWLSADKDESSIESLLEEMDETFAVTLLKLIDLKGMTDVECYKRANVSKQTWYKILNEKNYKPSKNTVIAFAISLKLTYEEAQSLLSTVGFTLSKSIRFDVIIEYFLKREIYDIMKINQILFEFDQPCLGV